MNRKRDENKSKSEVELPLPVWMKIMYCCDNRNLTEICKCVYCYSVQTIKNVKELERNGFVTSFVKGRMRIVQLTKKGKVVSDACKTLINSLTQSKYATDFLSDLNAFDVRQNRMMKNIKNEKV